MTDTVRFELADRRGRLVSVHLQQEVGLAEPLALSRSAGFWRLEVPRPDVDRMEYLFEITDVNGRRSTITDPGNPRRAGGAFGDKSVFEFPGYRAPCWLDLDPVPADERELSVDATTLGQPVVVSLWTPAGLDPDQPAPLVFAHDGPEYASLGGLTHYLGAMIAKDEIPVVRAALVDPGDRNDWYAADPQYAQAVIDDVLPAVSGNATAVIGLGASLGALALLHALRSGAAFDALLLQSGSFFTTELDPQESSFPHFGRITSFTASVRAATGVERPVPTVLTCGTVEENLENNREMATQLTRLGHPAAIEVVRDAHNYTAWRDALHPHLARLVREARRAS